MLRCMLLQAPVLTCLFLPAWVMSDPDSDAAGEQLIERKAQLGYQMLSQIKSAESQKLIQDLKALSESVSDENIGQRLKRLDSLLATIANHYRQRHDRTELLAQQDKARYIELEQEIESLQLSLDEVSNDNISPELQDMTQRFRTNFDSAEKIATRGDYTQALLIMERAKQQIVLIVTALNQSRTIEYKLEFHSVNDELEYEIRRYSSQMMLIKLAMQERPQSTEMAERVQDTLNNARAMHQEAKILADSAHYQAALDRQESAVSELNSILRLMGYFF